MLKKQNKNKKKEHRKKPKNEKETKQKNPPQFEESFSLLMFSYHNHHIHLEVPEANARHHFRGPLCHTVAAQLTVRFVAK